MTITLQIPDALVARINPAGLRDFHSFLQCLLNRRAVGSLRYEPHGRADRRRLYMRRLSKELRRYRESGNFEQLLNIAVYCFLESQAPENRKFHFDNTAASATRKDMDGNIA